MTNENPVRSIPGVCDVIRFRGHDCAEGRAPDVVFEVPHGATLAAHFDELAGRMRSRLPESLRDFFFVNTDVGAPELAIETAEQFVEEATDRAAVVVRCLVPRTLIDCNRVVDHTTKPAASAAGAMTPGVPSYITDAEDLALLRSRHAAYHGVVAAAFESVLGAGGGLGLMVHTYAPRSVDVPVDDRIVESLRDAYRPEKVGTWPLRAPVDLITTAPDGAFLADPALADLVEAGAKEGALEVARNGAYALHSVATAHAYAVRYAARTLCLEVRRDLLVPEFTPFAEMRTDAPKVARIAKILADAVRARLAG